VLMSFVRPSSIAVTKIGRPKTALLPTTSTFSSPQDDHIDKDDLQQCFPRRAGFTFSTKSRLTTAAKSVSYSTIRIEDRSSDNRNAEIITVPAVNC